MGPIWVKQQQNNNTRWLSDRTKHTDTLVRGALSLYAIVGCIRTNHLENYGVPIVLLCSSLDFPISLSLKSLQLSIICCLLFVRILYFLLVHNLHWSPLCSLFSYFQTENWLGFIFESSLFISRYLQIVFCKSLGLDLFSIANLVVYNVYVLCTYTLRELNEMKKKQLQKIRNKKKTRNWSALSLVFNVPLWR